MMVMRSVVDGVRPATSVAMKNPCPQFVSLRSAALFSLLITTLFSVPAPAMVFINEAFLNPKGSATDQDYEFIELMGTPGMKLDGYAVAILNGTGLQYYLEGSTIPPIPSPEIDEFFSLDGLTLGANGILALVIRDAGGSYFTSMLSDSNWVNWNGLWNGGVDVPGEIKNDGSTTLMLIRNRPGATEANPTDPAGLIWGKTIQHDHELITDGDDVPVGYDKFGDGHIDIGDPNGLGGTTLDMTGVFETPGDLSDDLEVVDEVSFEDDAGHEYDTDDRHVDFRSTHEGFPHRHVHSLDNPISFNPDALTRVDYRTTGDGWAPSGGGAGEMPGGNNWQDMATEQWIRGNSVYDEIFFKKYFFYDNAPTVPPEDLINPVQPYKTNVPLWLVDGAGLDFDFSTQFFYEIMAGRINPLSVAFIPGDVDRDGDCDGDDITKLASVFGDDDWIFSNSYAGSPEGSEVDPATQTKPWDVDGTGDNGIEASDLQWVLNFQGDTTGRIVGVRYDSATPAAAGVTLNSNASVTCSIGTSVTIPSGRTDTTLMIGDTVEITVSAQVTAGANSTAGAENGIMQYAHDLSISTGGVMEVVSVDSLGSFTTTRPSLQQLIGNEGDEGIELINGYTTSFAEGISGWCDLYKVTLEVIGAGSADVTIRPAAEAKFAASTPEGVKVGHTDNNGDPAASVYPPLLPFTATIVGDFTCDSVVDLRDFARFSAAWLSETGDANWDPACDISNPNGMIETGDLTMLLENWVQDTAIPGDITGNGCVDLADYARISAAWLSEPGDGNWDAACDISPPADLIDTADLCLLAENLTQGCGP
jgi:hypothetical protein